MSDPAYSFIRYLAAKKSVDDRALNRHVLLTFEQALREIDAESVQILEVGAGIGTMVERLVEWAIMPNNASYTAVDAEETNVAEARKRLVSLADCPSLDIRTLDAFALLDDATNHKRYDVLIAHAFLDLIDLGEDLPRLLRLLKPGGIFWLTVNFDGVTAFEPPLDPAFDARIIDLYHASMEARTPRATETGRCLLTHLPALGGEILAAGSSDWVVVPQRGRYFADEAYFLHFIIHTVDMELRHHPDLDSERFAEWVATRHQQIERGELIYIAHQLDMVGTLMERSL